MPGNIVLGGATEGFYPCLSFLPGEGFQPAGDNQLHTRQGQLSGLNCFLLQTNSGVLQPLDNLIIFFLLEEGDDTIGNLVADGGNVGEVIMRGFG